LGEHCDVRSGAEANLENAIAWLHVQHLDQEAIDRPVCYHHKQPGNPSQKAYYRTFRPYIRFFENVSYETNPAEGTSAAVRMNFRGETGAQSSIMPTLVAFMKIPHKPSMLTNHLADMRNYMPSEHRRLIEAVEEMPSIRDGADDDAYNAVLDAMADFRAVHYEWAQEYINRRTSDPRGTGGTPYMKWLRQLIDETRAFRKL
jgi:indoleamine 2,3-dioxygenase